MSVCYLVLSALTCSTCSVILVYHNYTYSHLNLGRQLIFSILPPRLALKIHLSRYIPSSPSTSSSTLPPPACFSSQPTIIPCERLPGCQSSTAVTRQRADERVHICGRFPLQITPTLTALRSSLFSEL